MLQRALYLGRMAAANLNPGRFRCQNCGATESTLVSRKKLVTTLRRCRKCDLMFRTPTDSSETSSRFYDLVYDSGFTTQMPDDEALEQMKASDFKDTPKNFDSYISVVERLGVHAGARIFDFGCSWGYAPWQMTRAGYDVWAAEVSKPRAAYAVEKLGVRIAEDPAKFAADPANERSFDCFFSCHVIEHVPAPAKVFEIAARLLRPGGIFLSFTPNGSEDHRAASSSWDQLWGALHPNFIDDRFLHRSFPNAASVVTSRDFGGDVGDLRIPESGQEKISLDEYELIFAARLGEDGKGF